MSRRGGDDVFFSLGHTALYTLWITCDACDIRLQVEGYPAHRSGKPTDTRGEEMAQGPRRRA